MSADVSALLEEAQDEIERLRAEVSRYRDELDALRAQPGDAAAADPGEDEEARLEAAARILRWYRACSQMKKFRSIATKAVDVTRNQPRMDVIKGLLEAERTYVKNLSLIMQVFMQPLRVAAAGSNRPIVTRDDVRDMFCNVDSLLKLHRPLLNELENRLDKYLRQGSVEIGDVLLDLTNYLYLYKDYVENYTKAIITLNSCKAKRPAFANFLKKADLNPYTGRFGLDTLLYMPVAYLARCNQHMDDLLAVTNEDNPDFANLTEAHAALNGTIVKIANARTAAENLHKVMSIHSSLLNSQAKVVDPRRKFVREGLVTPVRDGGASGGPPHYLFLFSDLLIATSMIKHPKTPFKVIVEVPLDQCLIETVPDGGSFRNAFSIVTTFADKLTYKVSSPEERQTWIHDIKICIAQHIVERDRSSSGNSIESAATDPASSNVTTDFLRRVVRSTTSLIPSQFRRTSTDDLLSESSDTELHRACFFGKSGLVATLLEDGADVDRKNDAGETPLHIACANGRDKVILQLFQYSAEPNCKNAKGDTPLHHCAINNNVKAVRILLEKGADPQIRNNDGLTAGELCVNNKKLHKLISDHTRHSADYKKPPAKLSRRSSFTPSFGGVDVLEERPDGLTLLAGENITFRVDDVRDTTDPERPYLGFLVITNFRVMFCHEVFQDRVKSLETVSLPLCTIDRVEKSSKGALRQRSTTGDPNGAAIELYCKNHQFLRLTLSATSQASRRQVVEIIAQDMPFFAHFHNLYPKEDGGDGWHVYNPERDFVRLGLPDAEWRYTDANLSYKLCPTYPKVLVVPASMTDTELMAVAAFRSKGRIPSICWRSRATHGVLARCSQPRVGLMNARCAEDIRLLQKIAECSRSPTLQIVDCRPRVNAVANQAKGAGFESEDVYKFCKITFMDIENIHVMRESLRKVADLVMGMGAGDDARWLSALENTHWLYHLKCIFGAVRYTVDAIQAGSSVLVHCSDGWDRTAQIMSLSELVMDPHYRTLRGFESLIEKEWLSFGHKFEQRIGHGPPNRESSEKSPVFVQFLDCVWQLQRQFPTAFEFNEHMLITIIDNLFSCRFGTFLYNCERQREQEFARNAPSLWTLIHNDQNDYVNPDYAAVDRVLVPSASMWDLQLWIPYYGRFRVAAE